MWYNFSLSVFFRLFESIRFYYMILDFVVVFPPRVLFSVFSTMMNWSRVSSNEVEKIRRRPFRARAKKSSKKSYWCYKFRTEKKHSNTIQCILLHTLITPNCGTNILSRWPNRCFDSRGDFIMIYIYRTSYKSMIYICCYSECWPYFRFPRLDSLHFDLFYMFDL